MHNEPYAADPDLTNGWGWGMERGAITGNSFMCLRFGLKTRHTERKRNLERL